MGSTWFDEALGATPVMAILRSRGVERSLELATTAWDLGIRAVEVTIQSDTDERALHEVAFRGAERGVHVGAGTITTVEQVERAVECGA
ncbi:MAG: 2-dehydro-3-deoxyphosphogluconate aldolase, partial [Mycetocola sp.]